MLSPKIITEYNFRLSPKRLDALANDIYTRAINTQKTEYILENQLENHERQYSLILIKPGLDPKYKNINLSAKNIKIILKEVFKTGWELSNVIAYDSSAVSEKIIRQHYPHFWVGTGENIMSLLKDKERTLLAGIYGEKTLNYRIIHAVDLLKQGVPFMEMADLWIKHEDHALPLEKRVNILNQQEPCPLWGLKRVLFVDKKSKEKFNGKTYAELFAAIEDEKFFIYDGFISHMIERFTRPGEKILVMLFAKSRLSNYDQGSFRKYVARRVRNDLVRIRDRTAEKIFKNETIIHCSDPSVGGVDHIWREIRTWFPDKENDEIINYFRPERGMDVSAEIFLSWMHKYRKNKYSAKNQQRKFNLPQVSFATVQDVIRIRAREKQKLWQQGKIIVAEGLVETLLPAGGTGGRFFGYGQEEETRIKLLAEVLAYQQHPISSLEARLRFYLKQKMFLPLSIMASDKNVGFMTESVLAIAKKIGYPTSLLHFYYQVGLPRFNPTLKDLLGSDKFEKEIIKKIGKKNKDFYKSIAYKAIAENGTPGDYFRNDQGEIETKAPGSISVLTSFIINGHLERLIRQGKKMIMISNGEDLGAVFDPVKAAYLMKNKRDCLIVVTDSQGDRGSIIKDAATGEGYIAQAEQLPDQLAKERPTLANVNNIYIKLAALLDLLGTTEREFLNLNKYQILELVQERIIKKLAPAIEIKPVPVGTENIRFCAQFTLADEDIVNLLPKKLFVYEPRENALYQMKTQDDIPLIEQRIKDLLDK